MDIIERFSADVKKLQELKNTMIEVFDTMGDKDIDGILFLVAFSEGCRAGEKLKEQMDDSVIKSQRYTSEEMMIFGKFAKDFKSPKNIGEAFDYFAENYEEMIETYELK